MTDGAAHLNLHVLVQLLIQVASIGKDDHQVHYEEHEDDQEHSSIRQTIRDKIWRGQVVPLLESMTLTRFGLEGSADCLEHVVRRQSSLESHSIDRKLRVQVAAERLPVFRGMLQHIIVAHGMVFSVESLIHTLLDDIGIDGHFFHNFVALGLVRSVVEDLVGPLGILEEHGLWGHEFDHLLLGKIFAFFVHVEGSVLPALDLAVQTILSQVLHEKLFAVDLQSAVVLHGAVFAVR